jgi:hypothetical protein
MPDVAEDASCDQVPYHTTLHQPFIVEKTVNKKMCTVICLKFLAKK